MPVADFANVDHVRDILEQPSAVERCLEFLAVSEPPSSLLEICLSSPVAPRIVLTGMGASFNALYPLHLRLLNHGFWSLLVETSELVHYQQGLLNRASVLLVVSQSGRSAEIVRLLERAGNLPIVAITNNEDSPLARAASWRFLLQAGEESGVSTKTYVTTHAVLCWLGCALTECDPAGELEALRSATNAMRKYLDGWETHVDALRDWLEGVQHIFVVGRGPSLATALEAGLILKEAAHFPAEGMGSAAFRHGPLDMARPGILVCVLAGLPSTRALNRGLAQDIEAAGARVGWISSDAELPFFRFDPVPDHALPLLEILPLQMVSLALCLRSGKEPGRFVRLSKVTETE